MAALFVALALSSISHIHGFHVPTFCSTPRNFWIHPNGGRHAVTSVGRVPDLRVGHRRQTLFMSSIVDGKTVVTPSPADISSDLEKMSLALEWFFNPDHLPFVIAQEKGFFAKHLLEVDIIEPQDHFDPLVDLQEGKLDAAVTETLHLLQYRAGESKPNIVGFSRFFHTLGGVMYCKDGPFGKVTRPRDLASLTDPADGKKRIRLQYPGAPGKGGPAIIKSMIEADGGDLTDVEIVPVNEGFYHTKALKKNKADVATLIFANFEVPEAKAQGVDAGFFHLKYNAVPDFCQLILIAQPHKLKDAKEASKLRRLNTALNEASDYLKLNPLEAKEIWFKRFPAKDAAEKAYMSQILDLTLLMFPSDCSLSQEYWENLGSWLHKTEQITEIPPYDYWTNELVNM